MSTQHDRSRFKALLSVTALLFMCLAGSEVGRGQEYGADEETKQPGSILVRRDFDTKVTVYRDGEPVVVPVLVRRVTIGGGLKGYGQLKVHEGPTLVQLRAGEVELRVGGRGVELDEGEYRVVSAKQPLVVTTEDDTAIIQYVSTGPGR